MLLSQAAFIRMPLNSLGNISLLQVTSFAIFLLHLEIFLFMTNICEMIGKSMALRTQDPGVLPGSSLNHNYITTLSRTTLGELASSVRIKQQLLKLRAVPVNFS